MEITFIQEPQLTTEPTSTSTEESSIGSPFSSLWGSPRPVPCSLPSTVGLLAGEQPCTRRPEGANQALWPASSAALPSARSSGTAQAHTTALVKVWECRVQFPSLAAEPQSHLDMNWRPEQICPACFFQSALATPHESPKPAVFALAHICERAKPRHRCISGILYTKGTLEDTAKCPITDLAREAKQPS